MQRAIDLLDLHYGVKLEIVEEKKHYQKQQQQQQQRQSQVQQLQRGGGIVEPDKTTDDRSLGEERGLLERLMAARAQVDDVMRKVDRGG